MYIEREKKISSFIPIFSNNKPCKWDSISNLLTPLLLWVHATTANRKARNIKRRIWTNRTKCQGSKSMDTCLLLPFSSLNSVLNSNSDSLPSKISLQGLVSHVILFSFPLIEITVVLKAYRGSDSSISPFSCPVEPVSFKCHVRHLKVAQILFSLQWFECDLALKGTGLDGHKVLSFNLWSEMAVKRVSPFSVPQRLSSWVFLGPIYNPFPLFSYDLFVKGMKDMWLRNIKFYV